MATAKQEQLYNEIVEYYNFADRLIRAVENTSEKYSTEQFEIVEETVSCLETCADKLANQYIEFIKNGGSEENSRIIRECLSTISSKVEECKQKIIALHQSHQNEEDNLSSSQI